MMANGVEAGATRARVVLQDMQPGDEDHADFRDVASGGILWKASLVLLHFLERKVELRGKKIIEISSGEGHLAVCMYVWVDGWMGVCKYTPPNLAFALLFKEFICELHAYGGMYVYMYLYMYVCMHVCI